MARVGWEPVMARIMATSNPHGVGMKIAFEPVEFK
jgi:hypothetical protein